MVRGFRAGRPESDVVGMALGMRIFGDRSARTDLIVTLAARALTVEARGLELPISTDEASYSSTAHTKRGDDARIGLQDSRRSRSRLCERQSGFLFWGEVSRFVSGKAKDQRNI